MVNGVEYDLRVEDEFYIPASTTNLLSLGELIKNYKKSDFQRSLIYLQETERTWRSDGIR